jgi:hypothetical protein
MISVGMLAVALPSGIKGRCRKTLKNKRKLAWLLRHCYRELLPPINKPWGPSLGGSFQAVGRAPLVVLVYAINRCTSADSLEYVKSAS